MKLNLTDEERALGMGETISRRDFVGSTLAGTGMALLAGCSTVGEPPTGAAPEATTYGALGSDWTGPGGIGDYGASNGDTAEVVNAAHAVRDGYTNRILANVIDTGETYDLVVVGGGFAGLSSAYTLQREYGESRSCLLLDTHAIFGGEAKQNEFMVDGHRLLAPQGSNGFVWPPGPAAEAGLFHEYWSEIGLPSQLSWNDVAAGTDKALRFPRDNYTAMGAEASNATTGFFYDTGQGGTWVIDPHQNGFAEAPISARLRADLGELYGTEPLDILPEDWPAWLDGMTLRSLLLDEMRLDPGVLDYVNGTISTSGGGLSASVVSAYACAQYYAPPAGRIWSTVAARAGEPESSGEAFTLVSFPGGNTGIARAFVKKMIPQAIRGGTDLNDILSAPLNWDSLDREGEALRLRMRSMVVAVEHDGPADTAEFVNVVYMNTSTGQAYRVRARSVMMGSGGWVNKHIVRDLPRRMLDAYAEFHHAPILTVNVAVRNWRFMERLGISGAQWFNGFGWFTNLRAPLNLGEDTAPLNPDRPAVLTFYVPFLYPELELAAQSIVSRTELLNTPYRQFELRIRQQMTTLFGAHGFDAGRDIAAIVTNRWGHAYIVPQPGYYFGRNGNPAPREIVREGFGRVTFGHSELTGEQLWNTAVAEGQRATVKLMAMI